MFRDIYKNKKVLITGHTGFKGSWMTLWLTELGAKVCGYSLAPPTDPSLFETLGLEDKITRHVVGDVRDRKHLADVVADFEPEFIFHLAAQPIVRLSYREPVETYMTNIMGTIHVLEAARGSKSVKTVVNITSDKCYENREWVFGYRETDPMGGYDPYSSSKGCSELVTAAYRNSFFNPADHGKSHGVSVASARAGNVIGGGDWAEDRLIPDCVRALTKDEIIKIRNPIAIRPWQHVLEPVSGYLWLGALMHEDPVKYTGGWNFGPNDDSIICVEDIVKQGIQIWGSGKYEVNPDTRFHEAKLLKLDVSKSRFNLQWKPVYSIKQTVMHTIEWYKTYYSKSASMYEYTMNQINDYAGNARNMGVRWSQG